MDRSLLAHMAIMNDMANSVVPIAVAKLQELGMSFKRGVRYVAPNEAPTNSPVAATMSKTIAATCFNSHAS